MKTSVMNMRVSDILLVALYGFMLLENPVSRIIPIARYSDELFLVMASLSVLMSRRECPGELNRLGKCVIAICFLLLVIGFGGNLISHYQESGVAVAKDAFAFLKFPIGLTACIILFSRVGPAVLDGCVRLSKVFIGVSAFFAIFNLFVPVELFSQEVRYGITSFQFIFTHPTFLVLALVLSYAVLVADNHENWTYKLLCLFTLAMTMRDKAFGFIALALFLILVKVEHKKRILPYLLCAAIAVLIVAWPKISLYLSFPNSPREAMYSAAVDLAVGFLPFGAGFATIASSLSGEYYAKTYYLFGFDSIPGMTQYDYSSAGDAGFAYYLGVFGFIGFGIFLYMLYRLYRYLIDIHPIGSQKRHSILILFGYIVVALTVESTLTNASGMQLAFVLALFGTLKTPGQDRLGASNER